MFIPVVSWLFFIFYHLFCLSVLRGLFFFLFRQENHFWSDKEVWRAFYLGAKFDAQIFLLVFALSTFPFLFNQTYHRLGLVSKRFFSLTYLLSFFILFVFYATDFGHYSYLQSRLNAGVIDLIENPLISLQMVWQTYPVLWGTFASILIALFHLYFYNRFLRQTRAFQAPLKIRLIQGVSLFLIYGVLSYGKISYFPLRWSEAYFSKDSFINNLAANPVMTFLVSLNYRQAEDYNIKEVERYYPLISDFLQVPEDERVGLNFIRTHSASQVLDPAPNIVIILMESMAHDKSSLSDNPLDPTPFIAKLAEQSAYFPTFYTPTESTARGIFSTLTGIADVTLLKSSSRNPNSINHQTIFDQFQGYERFYFLGGSASWGNIRALFTNNIENIQIYEEGSYQSNRVDVWGISDLDLFKEAHNIFEKQQRPFIALVQTGGFHRPYTIPKENDGFVMREDITAEQIQNYGFSSLQEYNSIRFQDYTLQRFFELNQDSDYYPNTIFAILGDHGLSSTKSLHVPSGFYRHRLVNHHVPLVIHWKEQIKPQVLSEVVGSQVDVMPTVAKLAGIPFVNTTLGRDLFSPRTEENNFAFIFTWNVKPYQIGLVGPDFYFHQHLEDQGLFQYASDDPLADHKEQEKEIFEKMRDLTHGLFETSRYLLFNNRKE